MSDDPRIPQTECWRCGALVNGIRYCRKCSDELAELDKQRDPATAHVREETTDGR